MPKYTKEKLKTIIPNCKSMADICRYFEVKPATGTQSHLSRKIKEWGLDISHFTGQGWNKGQSFPKKSVNDYCFKGSKVTSHKLKLVLIRDKVKEAKCEHCGIDTWMGEPVVLELDHIDSDHTNNEINNLQILCPNCHALKTRKNKKCRSGETG